MHPKSSSLSAKEYKEYLEDMELKIRYMKNDIEFKQNQMNVKASQPKGGGTSMNLNCRFNSSVHRQPNQVSMASYAAARPHKYVEKNLLPGVRTVGCSSRFNMVQNDNNKMLSYHGVNQKHGNTHINVTMPSSTLSTNAFSNSVKNNLTETPKPVNVYPPFVSFAQSYASQIPPVQIHTTDIKLKVKPNRSETVTQLASSQTINEGRYLLHTNSVKPIYVSPSENQTVLSQSMNSIPLSASGVSKSNDVRPGCSLATRPVASSGQSSSGIIIKTKTSIPTVSSTRYKLVKNISVSSCNSLTTSSRSVVSKSPHKLTRIYTHSTLSDVLLGTQQSLQCDSLNTNQSSIAAPSSSKFHVAATCVSTQPVNRDASKLWHQRHDLKLKTSSKLVTKYKMTRLSPKIVSPKVMPKLHSPSTSQIPNHVYENKFKLDKRPSTNHTKSIYNVGLDKIREAQRHKPHKLEIVAAAKLVGKYKLKRLSPTSASKIAPTFYKRQQFVHLSSPRNSGVNVSVTQQRQGECNFIHRRMKTQPSSHMLASTSQSFNYKGNKSPFWKWKSVKGVSRNYFNQTVPWNARDKRTSLFKLNNCQTNSQETKNKLKLDRRELKTPRGKDAWINKASMRRSKTSLIRRYQDKPSVLSRYTWQRRRSLSGGHVNSHGNSIYRWSSSYQAKKYNQAGRAYFPLNVDPRNMHASSTSARGNLVMIHGVVYRYGGYSLNNVVSKRKGHSPAVGNMKLITVRGSHFHSDFNGKKLCRTATGQSDTRSLSSSARKKHGSVPGKHVNETSILAASQIVHRSISMAAAKSRKKNSNKWKARKHCIFFGRFGKCHRGDKCQFVHDPEKVAVCTRFLRGKCEAPSCPFSHNASVFKMPVCLHYLQGQCIRSSCSYLHVNVNPDAPVCEDFHNGYCELGDKCKKLHSLVCPSFAVTGDCLRPQPCTLLHRRIMKESQTDSFVNNRSNKRKRRRVSGSVVEREAKRRAIHVTPMLPGRGKPPSRNDIAGFIKNTVVADPVAKEIGVAHEKQEGHAVESSDLDCVGRVGSECDEESTIIKDEATSVTSPHPVFLSPTVSLNVSGQVPLKPQLSFISLLDEASPSATSSHPASLVPTVSLNVSGQVPLEPQPSFISLLDEASPSVISPHPVSLTLAPNVSLNVSGQAPLEPQPSFISLLDEASPSAISPHTVSLAPNVSLNVSGQVPLKPQPSFISLLEEPSQEVAAENRREICDSVSSVFNLEKKSSIKPSFV